ncbi:sensor histidine kinase [Sphaerotilus hippei]|nr:histidine kinase [Sphaerotilus hippei]
MTTPPLDLPRQVMRRASGVAVLTLLVALILGGRQAAEDTDQEVDAAMALAHVMAQLQPLSTLDDPSARQRLASLGSTGVLRHLELQVTDEQGRMVLSPAPAQKPEGPISLMMALHRHFFPPGERRTIAWAMPRPQGRAWTLSLVASAESEREEAMSGLLDSIGLLLTCVLGMLAVMRFNLACAFRPLRQLLAAMAELEHQRDGPLQQLPVMPVQELEQIRLALRQLASSLADTESQRRLLSHRILTLQEDERQHIAHELHDELGQRLTALRLDLNCLARQLGRESGPQQAGLQDSVNDLTRHCTRLQADLRGLLTHLRPFGPTGADVQDGISVARLIELLQSLVHSWATVESDAASDDPGERGVPRMQMSVSLHDPRGSAGTGSSLIDLEADPGQRRWTHGHRLPREPALALYRLSQEALTNAVRHARSARTVTLQLALELAETADTTDPASPVARPLSLHWTCTDDGEGLAEASRATQRGNGMAGMRERVWSLGGRWTCEPGPNGRGLRLRADLHTRLHRVRPHEAMASAAS